MFLQTKFKDYSIAVQIRNLINSSITPFGIQGNYKSQQLQNLLTRLFKYREYEVSYQKMKILCFGKKKYVTITQEELINYIVEKNLGENAINNYNYIKGYALRQENIINKQQFIQTLTLGLAFLQDFAIQIYRNEFESIFDQLDQRQNGFISQTKYIDFLKYYMGSESPMAINPTERAPLTQSQELISSSSIKGNDMNINDNSSSRKKLSKNYSPINQYTYQTSPKKRQQQIHNKIQPIECYSIKLISALEQFRQLIIAEVTSKCKQYDHDNDRNLTRRQSQKFLYEVLELQLNSIEFIMGNYLHFNTVGFIPYKDFIEVVCQLHFREIFTTIIKNQMQGITPNKILLKEGYFIAKVQDNCYFFKEKPDKTLLSRVFEELRVKSDHKLPYEITLQDFTSFILVQCCNNRLIFRNSSKKSTAFLNQPASIIEAENSNFEDDSSEYTEMKAKQFEPTPNKYNRVSEDYFRQVSLNHEAKPQSRLQVQQNYLSQSLPPHQKKQIPENIINPHPQNQKNIFPIQTGIIQQNRSKRNISNDNSLSQKDNSSFKQLLWRSLDKIITKYSQSLKGYLTISEIELIITSEPIFNQVKSSIKNKLNKFMVTELKISTEFLVGFVIHFLGEQALIGFNKKQIKGKSSMSKTEIVSVLFEAYNLIIGQGISPFSEFAQLLLNQNHKKFFTYKNYLQLIGRNLSVKMTF